MRHAGRALPSGGAQVGYEKLKEKIVPGTKVLLDDGLISLIAKEVTDDGAVVCEIVNTAEIGAPAAHIRIASARTDREPDVPSRATRTTRTEDEPDIAWYAARALHR